jgi:hypothetical protein
MTLSENKHKHFAASSFVFKDRCGGTEEILVQIMSEEVEVFYIVTLEREISFGTGMGVT